MKKVKRLLAVLLMIAMVLAFAVPAMATDETSGSDVESSDTTVAATANGTIKVTVSNAEGDHAFKAYQIFSGTLSADNTLTNVDWGTGIDESAVSNLYKALALIPESENGDEDTTKPFAGANTAASVADVLTECANNSYVVERFQEAVRDALATGDGSSTQLGGNNATGYTAEVPQGYYLIVDDAQNDDDGKPAAYASAAMLQVIPGKTASIAAKQDNVPSVSKYAGEEGQDDNAKYSVGDEIPYTIIGTTKNFVRAGEGGTQGTYSYKITDTMGAALDLVGEFSGANNSHVTSGVTVTLVNYNADGTTTTKDITTYFRTNDKPITYVKNDEGTHTLTLEAPDLSEITELTAQSEIVVTYSAKLNSNVTTGATANNTVSLVADDYEATSDTDEVFPLTLKVTKTDGETDKPLAGAEFRLYRLTDENTKEYAEITHLGSISSWTTNPTIAATVTTDEDGLVSIIGLGDGTYYLEETKAPAGYNPIEDIEIQIKAVTEETTTGLALTKLTYIIDGGTETAVDPEYDGDGKPTTNTPNLDKGIVPITVENNQGAQLPSTGGMGTTIFYVIGGILVVGAVVLLVTRKRMNAE